MVVTALKSGSFTIENFARNTTSLNGTYVGPTLANKSNVNHSSLHHGTRTNTPHPTTEQASSSRPAKDSYFALRALLCRCRGRFQASGQAPGPGRTPRLPPPLLFVGVVSAFSLTEGPYMLGLTQWWVAMWAEKREAKEKENPKNPK